MFCIRTADGDAMVVLRERFPAFRLGQYTSTDKASITTTTLIDTPYVIAWRNRKEKEKKNMEDSNWHLYLHLYPP